MDVLDRIKRLTITALVADEVLMGMLVLKGGNAIDIAYDMSSRGSIDVDFSMEKDFSEQGLERIRSQMSELLNQEFSREEFHVFDIKFYQQPEVINDAVKSFWGGYCLDFKVIEFVKYELYKDNIGAMRNHAIVISGNNSTKFSVDISRYEYVADKRPKEIEGNVVYVYSPEMIAIEKLRALCQQNSDYKSVVKSMTPKSRARDFYDIHNLVTAFRLDLSSEANKELCRHIFDAKRVPLAYLSQLAEQYELHRQSWYSVESTVNQNEELQEFDFYFDFVLKQAALIG
ncbi:nucleotidyl transferase AbiEii/AbiGii toxin family protein [Pedobacter gandavensis]|uniref:nucleotidyl transferase AbiEii/AbiGii toxin family protein n=1 Tax=Pedobacter gandavensis TaxID=2679963 RepID=UPI00247A1A75|nr:nucleotidyl transferase AbiEii/AbiGii toxin family protein [Pedobacter gandavensis]WGQ10827.1 nucleotidyl transferase AbiEii/AbiGii toxin family protein [Pedobacter gandavensis]